MTIFRISYTCLILLLLAIVVPSCDNCVDVTCSSNATCKEGICECMPGYSGNLCQYTNCTILGGCPYNATCIQTGDIGICVCNCGYTNTYCQDEIRNQYYGTYNATDICNGTELAYSLTMDNLSTASPAQVRLLGWGGYENPAIEIVAEICTHTEWTLRDTTVAHNDNTLFIQSNSNGTITDSLGTKFMRISYLVVSEQLGLPPDTMQCSVVLRKQ